MEDIYRWFRRTGIRYAGVLDMDSLCGELQENRHREGRRPVEESVVSVFRISFTEYFGISVDAADHRSP